MIKQFSRQVQSSTTLRFIIVGVSAAIFYFILFNGFYFLLNLPPYLSTILAYSIAFFAAYVLHREWTYRSSAPVIQSMTRYLIVQLLSMTVTAIVTQLAYIMMDLHNVFISVLATVFAGLFNYLFTSLWVFVDDKKETQ